MLKVICKWKVLISKSRTCVTIPNSYMPQWRQWDICEDRREVLLYWANKGQLVRCSSKVSSLWRWLGSYWICQGNGGYIKLSNQSGPRCKRLVLDFRKWSCHYASIYVRNQRIAIAIHRLVHWTTRQSRFGAVYAFVAARGFLQDEQLDMWQ